MTKFPKLKTIDLEINNKWITIWLNRPKVKNAFSSLNDLARVTRENTSAQIIGVTGSVGKTTFKNLISFVLKNYGKVQCSK